MLDTLGTQIQRMLVTAPANVKAIDCMLDIDGGMDNVVQMPRATSAPTAPIVRSSTQAATSENDGDESA